MMVIATLNARLQPVQRVERYDDPLHEFLRSRGAGSVEGGGTLLGADGEVESADVEVELHDPEKLDLLAQALELLGAPQGSTLKAGDRTVPLGRLEGMGVYLNGTDLPAEVYATSDVNAVIERLEELLGHAGELHGWWEGPRETALYFYGPSYDAMAELVGGYVAEEPLCARSRTVRLT